jgi:nicotinamide-nucleotide amidase
VRVEATTVVGDEQVAIERALRRLLSEGPDLVLTSGGLGPTHDDRTMAAVAAATGRPLEVSEEVLGMVLERSRGLPSRVLVAAETRRAVVEKQASLPRGARVLPPPGTAPGCVLRHGSTVLVCLPGPPWELAEMWESALETPEVAGVVARGRDPGERLLRIHGVVESQLVEALGAVDPGVLAEVEVGVCARVGEIEVTLRAPSERAAAADAVETTLLARFGAAVYSRDGRGLLEVVADLLVGAGQTLAVAESCTGGGLGAYLTDRPGASAWFTGGVIAYSDEVKRAVLGVPAEVIARRGAVSAECAEAMAAGARRLVGSEWALSVTGIAGPDGGTREKPVGLVYTGLAGPDGVEAREHRFRGDRQRIRERSTVMALHQLRIALASRAARAAGAPA